MDEITTQSVIDPISLAAIASFAQASLIEKPRLMGTVMDLSPLVAKGMKSVGIPRFGNLNVQKKQGATNLTAQKLTPTNDTISLVEHDAILVEVEDIAELQASLAMQEFYGKKIAEAMAKQFDKEIYNELLNVSSSPDHSVAYASGSTLSKGDFNASRRKMREAEVDIDDGDLFAIVSPKNEEAILNASDFVDVDKFGSEAQVLKAMGVVGRIYGFLVIPRAIASDDKNIFYHRTALGFAMQQQMKVESQRDLRALSNLLAASRLYGLKMMQAGKAAVEVGTA